MVHPRSTPLKAIPAVAGANEAYQIGLFPSISTLESVCSAFGISLAQFFAESEMVGLTPELKELFDHWVVLTPEQKQAALQMIRAMNTK